MANKVPDQVVTGLSVRVGAAILVAVLDKTLRKAEVRFIGDLSGADTDDVESARRTLEARVLRVHPDYRIAR